MKKNLLFSCLLVIVSFNFYAQIDFGDGYFINESNQKINCLIKNSGWKNNPTEFEYKLTNDENVQTASIKTTKEFAIDGLFKYIKSTVNIDRSTDDINKMGNERNPVFKKETLFLKVIIEGNANLYAFDDINLTRFFYSLNEGEINQLVYKRFLNSEKEIQQNNLFKQQLFNDLNCQNKSSKNLESLRYNQNEIAKLFTNYNLCTNSVSIDYTPKQIKNLFHLSVRPGLNLSNLMIENPTGKVDKINFEDNSNLRLGIEAEFVLPYYKNKWSIIVEPTYRSYSSELVTTSSTVTGGILKSKVKYNSIELPIGVRYYIFLNEKSKLFLNFSCVFDFSSNSNVSIKRGDDSELNNLEVSTRNNFGLGLGYKYGKRFSLEFRTQTSREILGSYIFWNSEYKSQSLILGYSIF